MRKDVDERINKGVLRWFSHVERMKKDRIAKRVMEENAQVVVQEVDHGRDGLIP